MNDNWLTQTFSAYGRPVVLLSLVCALLGLVFAAASATEIALVMFASGAAALVTLVVLDYQARWRLKT